MFCDTRSNKVLEFYRGSTILLIGGTGFVGKGLLEKVLRSLDVKKVYLLIRSKGGVGVEDRLEKLLEDRLFDQVREQVGKVEAVEVDYDLECLGLDDDVAERLQKDVEVVFYCLDDAGFNRPLKEAFQTNVQIGKYVLKWCRSFPNLKSVVYTSTFYSECTKNFVEEKIADDLPFGNYKLCMKMLTGLTSEKCESIRGSMLGDYPNTYTFTKKLAEIMVQKEFAGDLPIAVYRPSVGNYLIVLNLCILYIELTRPSLTHSISNVPRTPTRVDRQLLRRRFFHSSQVRWSWTGDSWRYEPNRQPCSIGLLRECHASLWL